MAGPVRKPRVRSAGGAPEKESRFALRLSLPVAGLLAAVLVVAVGWSFFMGYMVGRGQNPEQRVEQLTGLGGAPAAPAAGKTPARPLADTPLRDAAHTDTASKATPDAAPDPEQATAAGPKQDTAAARPAAPSGPTTPPKADAGKSKGPAAPQPPAKNAYPFARPSGGGLAAWGIKPGQEAPAQTDTAAPAVTGAVPAKSAPAAQGQSRPQTAQPLYDFVFQAAAFNNAGDADKLRSRLEGRGLRTGLQTRGKLRLVLVNLRGTDLDAANLREELQRMHLGAPLLKSKKAVAGKSRKSGR